VEVRPISESSTRFAALVSGQVAMLTGVPVELHDQISKNPQLEIVSKPARRSIFLALANAPGTPMADIRVRQAIYMAINEDEIIAKVMRGQASPAAQIPDPPTIGYNADLKRLPYDPQKAKALLKAAGYENGFAITWPAATPPSRSRMRYAAPSAWTSRSTSATCCSSGTPSRATSASPT
jgi:peptide/nickel transport system substrate-binding protein